MIDLKDIADKICFDFFANGSAVIEIRHAIAGKAPIGVKGMVGTLTNIIGIILFHTSVILPPDKNDFIVRSNV